MSPAAPQYPSQTDPRHTHPHKQRNPVYATHNQEDFGLAFANLGFTFRPETQDQTTSAIEAPWKIVRHLLEAEVATAQRKLSDRALALSDLPEMKRLDKAFNTASAHTGIFNHVDVSRYEHSIHAAAQVHDLKLTLPDYEKQVLELALLFHDIGHVPGSHAMDRVFATLPGSPPIGKWGYGKEDFHEVHGARLVCQGPSTERIREVCGDKLFGDVMAVLVNDDKRSYDEKVSYYGSYSPSLPQRTIDSLYALKDVLDRTSYLVLDHISAGYREDVVKAAREKVQRYLDSLLLTTDGEVCTKLSPQGGMELGRTNDPYEEIIGLRKNHFDEIPGHPSNGLVTLLLQQAVWREIEKWGLSPEQFRSTEVYERIRDLLVSGEYEKVLGEDTCRWLFDRNHCVADQVAPLATLRKGDLTERGMTHLEKARGGRNDDNSLPIKLVSGLSGAPIYDTTRLELLINNELQSRGIKTPIHLIVAHQLDKDFEYQIANGETTEPRVYKSNSSHDSGHVVISACSIDDHGQPVDLAKVQEHVERFLVQAKFVDGSSVFRERYNPKVFVEPFTPGKFCEAVQEKFPHLSPSWIDTETGQSLLQRHQAWLEL